MSEQTVLDAIAALAIKVARLRLKPATANYVRNPKASTSPWGSLGGLTITRETAPPVPLPSGFASCHKLVHASGTYQTFGIAGTVAVEPGDTWTASADIHAEAIAGGDSISIGVSTYDAAGVIVRVWYSDPDLYERVDTTNASFVNISQEVEIAAGEYGITMSVAFNVGTGIYHVSGAMLNPGPLALYVDGDHLGYYYATTGASFPSPTLSDISIAGGRNQAALIGAIENASVAPLATDDLTAPLALIGNPATLAEPGVLVAYGSISGSEYDDLYNDRVDPGMVEMFGGKWREADTDTIAVRLMHWIRSYLSYGYGYGDNPATNTAWYQGDPYTVDYADLASNLAWHDAGNDGVCSFYSHTLLHVFACVGIVARDCNWNNTVIGGDIPLEYYSPERRQWTLLAPIDNCRFRDGGPDGPLMSMLQMHLTADRSTIYVDEDPELNFHDPLKPWQPADGVATGIIVADSAILDYLDSVRWSLYAGPAFDLQSSYVQWDDNVTPFPVGTEINDPTVLEFDAFVIKIGTPTITGTTLTIPIADSVAAWTPTYTATAYSYTGAALRAERWTNGSGAISVAGTAYVTVSAENVRGGKSNHVRIEHDPLAAIKAKTDTIGALEVTVTSPVAADGTVTVYAGDSYPADTGRSITIQVADPTHAFGLDGVDATVQLRAVEFTWEASSVVSNAAGYLVTFEPTIAQTSVLRISTQDYKLIVTYDGTPDDATTIQDGTALTVRDIPVVPAV